MMSELQQKIIGEGEAAQKVYDEFAEWCEEESKNLQFEIKTGKAQAEELTSTIEKAVADLKAATEIRNKENSDFLAVEAELVDTVDALERAIGILEREMAKTGGAAFLQVKNADNIVAALKVLVQSASISSSDGARLTAFLQSQQENGDNDAELGAPAAKSYESKSGGIVDVLNDLLADAEGQLEDARKKELNLQNNYEMLKLELEDAIKFGGQEIDKTKKQIAACEETKATAEGDLEVTNKALAEDIKQLAETHQECMTKATDFEAETASRGEELKVLAQAKKIIIESTGGATAQTYSFLQLTATSRMRTRADLANMEAVKFVKKLSETMHSAALAQLANRMAAAARMGAAGGEDPFAKVKGLISEMIERLLKEAAEDAAHKAYCDKEMAETKAKKEELTDEITALTTKIDKMSAQSAQLKEEVAVLSKELADLEKSQAEMDKLREEENTEYNKNKAEMEKGLEGIKLALKVLREYYAKGSFMQSGESASKAEGAAAGIIGMLEVVESDFSKGLAEMIAIEEEAAAAYEKQTKENEIAKVTKTQDVKYKTKEAKTLDKAVVEQTSDREGLQTELDAVLDYWEKIQEQCVAKPEPYEERKKRREAEIAGLKEALAILEGEAALIQKGAVHITLRRHQ